MSYSISPRASLGAHFGLTAGQVEISAMMSRFVQDARGIETRVGSAGKKKEPQEPDEPLPVSILRITGTPRDFINRIITQEWPHQDFDEAWGEVERIWGGKQTRGG